MIFKLANNIGNTLILVFIALAPLSLLFLCDIDHGLFLTFLLQIILMTCFAWVILYFDEKNIANIFVFIFFYLFFLVAPIIQLGNNNFTLVNTSVANVDDLFWSNMLTFLFIGIYLLTYLGVCSRFRKGENYVSKNLSSDLSISDSDHGSRTVVFYILLVLSFVASIIALQEVLAKTSAEFLLELSQEKEETSALMLRTKVLYNIPLATLVYFFFKRKGKYSILIFCLLFVLILITKNPLIERRHALGPTYLLILFVVFDKWFNSNRRTFVFSFLFFLIFFPLTSLLTHGDTLLRGEFSNISVSEVIGKHFVELHYDAWANLSATLEYVRVRDFTYGQQLLGTLFFYFPRFLWVGKPQPTGAEVGDYLMQRYDMWFNQLSSPIVAEGYIDFGVLGVVIYAIGFGYLCAFLGRSIRESNGLGKYTSIYVAISLMAVLRGPLMPTFSFTLGAMITFLLIPWFLFKVVKWIKGGFSMNWKQVPTLGSENPS